MSGDDWQIGDWVICVREGALVCRHGWHFGGKGTPRRGAVRKILAIAPTQNTRRGRPDQTCGCKSLIFSGDKGHQRRFVKLSALTDKERDEFKAELDALVQTVMPLSSAGEAA